MAIYIDENGKKSYYYYKKKIGRPKKRGPKKKPKKRGRSWQETWDYKIIQCNSKKQEKVIGYFHNITEAINASNILKERNKDVVFPIKIFNDRKIGKRFNEYNSEYVILEKIRTENTSNISKLRNEYGKIVEVSTTNSKWKIYDRFERLEEETFWVYGLNPRVNRKDFTWIQENFIKEFLQEDNLLIIRIVLYYNKILFRYDNTDFNFIICKNESDAIRFYNKLLEINKKEKRIVFTGKVINKSDMGETIINLIADKTGWSKNKIIRTSTI